jgi:hypothetical protein
MNEEIAPAGEDLEQRFALRRPMPLLAAVLIAALLSGPQLFVGAFLVPKMTAIYQDLFGGLPLPTATAIVLHLQWPFVAFAFLWSLGNLLVMRRRGSTRHFIRNGLVAIIPVFLTTAGLILPLIPVVTRR